MVFLRNSLKERNNFREVDHPYKPTPLTGLRAVPFIKNSTYLCTPIFDKRQGQITGPSVLLKKDAGTQRLTSTQDGVQVGQTD
jgi:hypothetical protein